jgi:transcriptional regulator with XRE-family HTH domain
MKRDRIDILLQLAYLEGSITTHGLYEMAAAKREPLVAAPVEVKGRLQKRLEEALGKKTAGQTQAMTVGVFLRQWRTAQAVRPQEIFSRLGVSPNIYSMLEHDRISPLKIPIEVWRKLRSLFRISTDELVEMIRRSHQLVLFRPSFRTTLARYDSRKNRAMKTRTLRQAAEELYARAALDIPQEEKEKLEKLLSALKKG